MIRNRIASWIQPTSERPEIAQRQAVLNVICLGLAVVLLALGLILLIPAALGMGSFLFPLAFLLAQPFLYLSYWLGKRDLVVPGAAVQASVVFMIVVVLLAFFGIDGRIRDCDHPRGDTDRRTCFGRLLVSQRNCVRPGWLCPKFGRNPNGDFPALLHRARHIWSQPRFEHDRGPELACHA
jgi:hypothetical protein